MVPVDLTDLERLLLWRLKRFADHLDYDDLEQECRIAAWRAASRYEGSARASTVIVGAIDWAAKSFFSGPQCRSRVASRYGVPNLVCVPLQSLSYGGEDPAGDPYAWEKVPRVEDFAPAVIDALYGQWLSRQVKDWLTPGQWEAIRLTILEGWTTEAAAKFLGRSMQCIWEARAMGLDRLRVRVGLPAVRGLQRRDNRRRARERRQARCSP